MAQRQIIGMPYAELGGKRIQPYDPQGLQRLVAGAPEPAPQPSLADQLAAQGVSPMVGTIRAPRQPMGLERLSSSSSDMQIAREFGLKPSQTTAIQRARGELAKRERDEAQKTERERFIERREAADLAKAESVARIAAGGRKEVAEIQTAGKTAVQSMKEAGLNDRQKLDLEQKDRALSAQLQQKEQQFIAGGGEVGSPQWLQEQATILQTELAKAQANNDAIMQRAIMGKQVELLERFLPATEQAPTAGEIGTAARQAEQVMGQVAPEQQAAPVVLDTRTQPGGMTAPVDANRNGIPDQNEAKYNFLAGVLKSGFNPDTKEPLDDATIEKTKAKMARLRSSFIGGK